MNLIINGEQHTLDVGTLFDVVSHFKLDENFVIAEVNGEIIDRDDWKHTDVQNGMTIELVHFVGGG